MNTFVVGRVQRILADILQIPAEQITPESSPDIIENWDSMNHLSLVLALEQEFGVHFVPEEIGQLSSVEVIVKLLEEKLHADGNST